MKRTSIVLLSALTVASAWAGNWPQFRGPGSEGISSEKGLPVYWSSTKNVRWKTRLPGPGHSSPIVWEKRIFLTAFEPKGPSGLLGGIFSSSREGTLMLLSLDMETGSILWQRSVPAAGIERLHDTNAPASPTPVTDGRYVYAYFGSYGVVCYDFEGPRWARSPTSGAAPARRCSMGTS